MTPPPPPPPDGIATRMLAAPALRLQPDGRLVKLVRSGSEPAFEEIVRRYGIALQRYAGAIVTRQRAEDVTQDAFSKAFVALRGSDKEIKLRPWLYRIVRNTALNELRDRPPQTAELDERVAGGEEPADTIERRRRVESLMAGLAELPEPQRAAIVMRELEGLSHAQIAKSLGLSGGAVRQSIHRARTTLRDGVGMLLPLPVLRALAMSGGPDAATSAVAGGAGVGLGVAAKAGIATLLVAGTATAGLAIHESRGTSKLHETPAAASSPGVPSSSGASSQATSGGGGIGFGSGERQSGHSGHSGHSGGEGGSGTSGPGHDGHGGGGGGSSSGPGSGHEPSTDSGGSGGSGSGSSGGGDRGGDESSGSGSGSGTGGDGGSGSGSGDSGGGGHQHD